MIHFIDELMHGLIIGFFGASSFIAFAMPHLYTGHPRRLVGGYIASVIVAVIVLFIMHYFPYNNKLLFATSTIEVLYHDKETDTDVLATFNFEKLEEK